LTVIAIGTGVSVGGNGVDVGGIGVGEAKIAGKFGAPPKQAVKVSKNKMTKTLFKMDILLIIPEELSGLLRQVGSKYNSAIPIFGKLK
jgi:hypothetical protein